MDETQNFLRVYQQRNLWVSRWRIKLSIMGERGLMLRRHLHDPLALHVNYYKNAISNR